jgi:gluconate 2-dehydrogenase gamma chain
VAISRRALLKRIGVASTAAVVPVPVVTPGGHEHPDAAQAPVAAAPAREAYETLTAAESDLLEAVTARLIPADATGPGAREARAAHYIDRALAGPLSAFRANYTAGLAALDAYARAKKGAPFAQLPPADQDVVLTDLQTGSATGFAQPPAIFFNLMRSHTIEGTFSDPYYGGNANFVGWDLIGYPGVRTAVSASEQQMNTKIAPNHRSAYDFAMFRKGGPDGH